MSNLLGGCDQTKWIDFCFFTISLGDAWKVAWFWVELVLLDISQSALSEPTRNKNFLAGVDLGVVAIVVSLRGTRLCPLSQA